MNCIIYTRWSPRPNTEECKSCEWQRAECEQYAHNRKWTVVAALDDPDRSGADAYRETLWSAIKRLKRGETLLVWKWDRLARDLMLALQIERAVQKRGATVTAIEGDVPGDDPHAQFSRHILMSVAELERKMISERTSAAMRAHQRAGRRMSYKPPYGWRVDPENPTRIVEDEAEQRTLAEIWRRHRAGESTNHIAMTLKPETARNGRWHTEVVRRIISHTERDK